MQFGIVMPYYLHMELEYTVNENKNGLVVTAGKDFQGELAIPSEYCFEGKIYPVIAVGNFAFYGCPGLTSIIVDKENEHYDSREGCNAIIKSDTNKLVAGCSTTLIPDSVTEIGDWAFIDCTSLASIVINDASLLKGAVIFKGVEIVKP